MLEFTNGVSAAAMLAFATLTGIHDFFVDLERCNVVNQLLHGLRVARSASNEYARSVTVCPSADRRTCSVDGDWGAGWIAFVDYNRDGELDRDERNAVVARGDNDTGGRVVVVSDYDRLTFAPGASAMGGSGAPAVTLCVQDYRGPKQARVIWIDGRGHAELHDRRPEEEVARNQSRDFSHRSKVCY